MAITRAQQYKQMLQKGGRIGFFKGAQADASAGKGAMSPGTSVSGGQRDNQSDRERGIRYSQKPKTSTTFKGTLSDPREKKDYFEKKSFFDNFLDYAPYVGGIRRAMNFLNKHFTSIIYTIESNSIVQFKAGTTAKT